MASTSKFSAKNIIVFVLLLALIIALSALSVVWFQKAKEVKKEVTTTIENFSLFVRSQQKGDFKVEKVSITGYPFSFKVNLSNITASKQIFGLENDVAIKDFSVSLPFLSNGASINLPKELILGETKVLSNGASIKISSLKKVNNLTDIKEYLNVANLRDFVLDINNLAFYKNNQLFYSADKLFFGINKSGSYLNFKVNFKNVAQTPEYLNKSFFEKITKSNVILTASEASAIAKLKELIEKNNSPLSFKLEGKLPFEAQKMVSENKTLEVVANLLISYGKTNIKADINGSTKKLADLDKVTLNINFANILESLNFLKEFHNLLAQANYNKIILIFSKDAAANTGIEYVASPISDQFIADILGLLKVINSYDEKKDLLSINYKKTDKEEILNGKNFADLKPAIDASLAKISVQYSEILKIQPKKASKKTDAKKDAKLEGKKKN